MATIASSYPEITKIALCGSGITPSSASLPILSTYPPVDEIRAAAAAFTGDVLHLRGGADTTVSTPSQEALYAAFTRAASKNSVVIDGANHNFSSVFGKDKPQAYTLYVERVVNFMLQ